MKTIKNGKIVIIGAGHVGSHCGLSLMMQGLATEIVYIDIDKNKAAMQALDLDDMASNLDRDFTVRAGDYCDCADAHIVVGRPERAVFRDRQGWICSMIRSR